MGVRCAVSGRSGRGRGWQGEDGSGRKDDGIMWGEEGRRKKVMYEIITYVTCEEGR